MLILHLVELGEFLVPLENKISYILPFWESKTELPTTYNPEVADNGIKVACVMTHTVVSDTYTLHKSIEVLPNCSKKL